MDTGNGGAVSKRGSRFPYCGVCDETIFTKMKGHLLGDTHQHKARGAALSFTGEESRYFYITVTTELREVSYWYIFDVLGRIGLLADFRFTGKPKPQIGTKIYVKYRTRDAAALALRKSNDGRLTIGSIALRLELAETEYLSREPPVEQALEEAPRSSALTDHTALLTKLTQQLSDRSEDDALCWLTDQLVLTPAEHQQRIHYCNQLEEALRSRFSSCLVSAYGSSVSGLGLRGCDLDLYAFIHADDRGSGPQPCINQTEKVRAVANFLKLMPRLCTDVVRVQTATVPIIKFRPTPMADIQCHLNLLDPIACQNSRLIGILMKTDPRMLPLTVVVRYWAQRRDLAGGEAHPLKMSSYCLTLLVVTFLQQLQPPVLPTVDA